MKAIRPIQCLVDTGGTQSLIGISTFKVLSKAIYEASKGRLQVQRWNPETLLTFCGVGGTTTAVGGCEIPVTIGSVIMWAQCQIVPRCNSILIVNEKLEILKSNHSLSLKLHVASNTETMDAAGQ